MSTRKGLLTLALALALVPAVAGCKKEAPQNAAPPAAEPGATPAAAPVSVTAVDLGSSIGADKKVNDNAPADEFKPKDTIYASVATEGTATNATLTARWTYQDGQVVDTTSQAIAPTGPAVTEFHIAKPDGWPLGKYKVEILLNGQTAQTKDFTVKKD